MTLYLSLKQILLLQERQLRVFGGPPGLRDREGLERALARPQMRFGGEDLYPDLSDKAAALMHSLVANHPFVDGNEQVGAMAAELFLAVNRVELVASNQELIDVTFAVARGGVSAEALAIWVRQRSGPRTRIDRAIAALSGGSGALA